MKFFPILPLILAGAAPLSAQDSIRQAGEGRFWLKVPAGQPPLANLSVSTGQAGDSVWDKDPEVAKRQKDIRFPIRWWAWQDITVTFTPAYDGSLDLILNGLWAQEKPGSLFREEALWDEISATGASVTNGGFEETGAATPAAWTSTWGAYPAPAEWPLAGAAALQGSKVGASWHNRPLQQTLQVKAGQAVTLVLHAKSATPPGFVPPRRLGTATPAHQAAALLKRGVNFGNAWEATPPYAWGVRYTPEDVDHVAAEGFDHIRIPVAWHHLIQRGPAGITFDAKLLADLDAVVDRALEKKLRVLVDWHHFYDLDKDPAANRGRFVEGWTAIANHFKSRPPELFFELLNEPHDNLTTEILNPIQTDAITAIRAIDPLRIIVLSPGDWGKIDELDKLVLPDADERLIVTVHCYEPFFFTHQNAHWTQLGALKNVTYPGPPATPLVLPEKLKTDKYLSATINLYNTVAGPENPSSAVKPARLLDIAKRWSDHFGRPVHLGEFGAIDSADHDSRIRYVRDVRKLAEDRGIPWTIWDWKARFGYWDPKTNTPILRPAIFE